MDDKAFDERLEDTLIGITLFEAVMKGDKETLAVFDKGYSYQKQYLFLIHVLGLVTVDAQMQGTELEDLITRLRALASSRLER